MTSIKASMLIALAGLFSCGDAMAVDSVKIGSKTYHCQNTCVVGKSSNGSLTVRDSGWGWGWVAIFVSEGAIDHQGPLSSNTTTPILTKSERGEEK